MQLCSYGWTLLALYFLQTKVSMIANIQGSYFGERQFITVNNRNDADPTKEVRLEVSFITSQDTLSKMILHRDLTASDLFLRFMAYSCLDYLPKHQVISVRRSAVVSREEIKKIIKAPDFMIIQDPIEEYRNIAKSVSFYGWNMTKGTGLHSLSLYKQFNSFHTLIE